MVGHDWGGAIAHGLGGATHRRIALAGAGAVQHRHRRPRGAARRRGSSAWRPPGRSPSWSATARARSSTARSALSWRAPRPRRLRQALRAPYRRPRDRAGDRRLRRRRAVRPTRTRRRRRSPTWPSRLPFAHRARRCWRGVRPTRCSTTTFALDLAARMPHADRHRFAGVGHLVAARGRRRRGDRHVAATDRVPRAPTRSPAPAGWPRRHRRARPAWAALVARRRRRTRPRSSTARPASAPRSPSCTDRVMGIARGLAELGRAARRSGGAARAAQRRSARRRVRRAGAPARSRSSPTVASACAGSGRAVRGAHVDWVIGPPQALAAARALRWAPRARTIAVGRAPRSARPRRSTISCASTGRAARRARCPTTPPPCCTRRAPPARRRACATGTASWPRSATRWPRTYGITADDRLVAAFAPFALYGPALGITSTIPDVDVTKPGTLTADALGAACASIDATIVFASPAALANVRAHRAGAPTRDWPRSGWCCRPAHRCPSPRCARRPASCPSAELHTPYGMTECLPVADVSLDADRRAPATGAGVCVGPPGAGRRRDDRRRSASTPASRRDGAAATDDTGEVLVRTPWLSRRLRPAVAHRARRPPGRRRRSSPGIAPATSATSMPTGRLWIEGRSVHVVAHRSTAPVTPVPVEVAVERLRRRRARAPRWASARSAASSWSSWSSTPATHDDGLADDDAVARRCVRARRPSGGRGAARVRRCRSTSATTPRSIARLVAALGEPTCCRATERSGRGERSIGAAVKVLVTGGTSLLARRTAEALLARGDEVVLLQRHAVAARLPRRCSATSATPTLVAPCGRTAATPSSTPRPRWAWSARGTTTAASTSTAPPTSIAAARVHGVLARRARVDAVGRPRRALARRAPAPSRRSPVARDAYYAESKAIAEQLALRRGERLRCRSSSIRPHLVWGPGRHATRRSHRRTRPRRTTGAGRRRHALIDTTYIDNAASRAGRRARRRACPAPRASAARTSSPTASRGRSAS